MNQLHIPISDGGIFSQCFSTNSFISCFVKVVLRGNAMEQIKEALLKKHMEQIDRVKKQATQYAITNELSKVIPSEQLASNSVHHFYTLLRRGEV